MSEDTRPQEVAGEDAVGYVDFGVSCDEAVRADFDRGIALLHHMTYPVAESIFSAVVERDPDCGMAYWGMAMTLLHPLWPDRPTEEDLRRGWDLVQEARRRGPGTPREEMFLAAGEAFYDPSADPDYWARIGRWAGALTAVYESHPDDAEAQAFFALAQLATASQSGAPADHHATAAATLAELLDAHPTHPGGVHYTIHANDFAGRERQSLDVVRSYGTIAPQNPHALHMPTHIFVRLGEWTEVIDWNLRAAEAALAQRVGPNGEWVWDEYPHAVEYLVYAYLQRGDDAAALQAISELAATPDLQPGFKTAFHLASTASRYALERKDWASAAQLPVRSPSTIDWDRYRWPEAVVWFARGLGTAHLGGEVTEHLRRLEELSSAASEAGEAPFAAQIEILRLELLGWQAHARGDATRAVELFRRAVELERETPKHPVTPAATIPALEQLGDLYLELDDPERALQAYRSLDEAVPNRFNTVLGMARSAAALGDDATAGANYARLLDLAADGSDREGLTEARAYAGR